MDYFDAQNINYSFWTNLFMAFWLLELFFTETSSLDPREFDSDIWMRGSPFDQVIFFHNFLMLPKQHTSSQYYLYSMGTLWHCLTLFCFLGSSGTQTCFHENSFIVTRDPTRYICGLIYKPYQPCNFDHTTFQCT